MIYIRNLLIIILILFAFSCEQNQPDTFVHNTKAFWGDKPQVSLEYEMQFGVLDGNDENYLLHAPWEIRKLSNGNFIILDTGNKNVKVFDPQGTFLWSFGKTGQGPGEFTQPLYMDVDRNDNIYIGEPREMKMKIFDSEGNEKSRFFPPRTHNCEVYFSSFFRVKSTGTILMGGDLMGTSRTDVNRDSLFVYREFNTDRKVLNTCFHPFIFHNPPMYYVSYLSVFELDENDNFYIAYGSENKVEKYDSSGKLVFSADRPLNKNIDINKAKFHLTDGRIHGPKNILKGIGIDKKNRIWVCTAYELFLPEEKRKNLKNNSVGHLQFDIFSEDGVLLGTLPVPVNMHYFRIIDNEVLIVNYERTVIRKYRIVEN